MRLRTALVPYSSATSHSPSSLVLHLSTLAMSDVRNSIKLPKSVEASTFSSKVTHKGEHGATFARERQRQRPNVDCIFKHLGLKKHLTAEPIIKGGSLSEATNKFANVESTQKAAISHSKLPESTLARDSDREKGDPLLCTSSSCTSMPKKIPNMEAAQRDGFSEECLLQDGPFLVDTNCIRMLEEHSLPTTFGKHEVSRPRKLKAIPSHLKRGAGSVNRDSKNNRSCVFFEPFDICPCQSQTEEFVTSQSEAEDAVFLRSPEDMGDAIEAIDVDQVSDEPKQRLLRPGMVLLKSHLTHSEQVSIIRECKRLGVGPGGFYQPHYNDRAKLRLHMMCLGLDWDPQTRKYQKQRRIDRAKPPDIPHDFHLLVDRAMQDSHALIKRHFHIGNAEEILPPISPDICIVNFYTETGRLGLHKDRDETVESLAKRLPVVSFSVGDSAEFLYGDERDPNKAQKLVLESGDVLIFGGESRHVFHGVASIIPNSAPNSLVEDTGLRPGRLNLTFRQY